MTLVIGHKGAAGLAPENSLEAFRMAREVGADGVELDVRRTADGALAVHHDPTLGDGRRLMDVATGELPAGIATLPPVLDACAGLALVNSMGNLAGLASPTIVGGIREATGSFTAALVCLAGARLVGAAIVLLFGQAQRARTTLARR